MFATVTLKKRKIWNEQLGDGDGGDGDGVGGDNGDGGHEGRIFVAHHIGLDNISLPGQQWPSKTITVQGSHWAWLNNMY